MFWLKGIYLGSATTLQAVSGDCSSSADETVDVTVSRSGPPTIAITPWLSVTFSICIFLRSLCIRKCLSSGGILLILQSSNTSGSFSPTWEQLMVAIASHNMRPLWLRNAVASPGIFVGFSPDASSKSKSFVQSPCKNLKRSGPLDCVCTRTIRIKSEK